MKWLMSIIGPLLEAALRAIFRKSPEERAEARQAEAQAKYEKKLKDWQDKHDILTQTLTLRQIELDAALHGHGGSITGLQAQCERLARLIKADDLKRPRPSVPDRAE